MKLRRTKKTVPFFGGHPVYRALHYMQSHGKKRTYSTATDVMHKMKQEKLITSSKTYFECRHIFRCSLHKFRSNRITPKY